MTEVCVTPGRVEAEWRHRAMEGRSYSTRAIRTEEGRESGRARVTGSSWAASLVEPAQEHHRIDVERRVEFELSRDPDRCDTRVARACSTNVILVRKVRQRLGVFPTRPV